MNEETLGLHNVDDTTRRMARAPWPAYAFIETRSREDENHQFIFMLPRKNASNTMKVALNVLDSSFPIHGYMRESEVVARPQLLRVAVIRNPIDRFVSCWRHFCWKVGASLMKTEGVYDRMPWDEFFDAAISIPDHSANYHYRSQWREVILDRMPDRTLHVEHLPSDWAVFLAEYNLPAVTLGRFNASTVNLPRVTKAQSKELEIRFRDDLYYFGYQS